MTFFGSTDLFSGISIIAVGNLHQLPPIKKRAIFENFKIESHKIWRPWSVFRMVELTEIMRQKNDKTLLSC